MNAEIKKIVKNSGSSFYYAMSMLPKAKREAMYTVYAFCRIVDDIADEPNPVDKKSKMLNEWRKKITDIYDGIIANDIDAELAETINKFQLPKNEFMAIIDGMEMDVLQGINAPSKDELFLYARRVAGAVGILSVKIFGDLSKKAEQFAIALGNALQFTNILRDQQEDLEMGRLYLPKEIIGEKIKDPLEVINATDIGEKRKKMAELALAAFKEAENYLKTADKKILKPAIVMMQVYYAIFKEMEKRGWDKIMPRVKLSKFKLLKIALWPKSTL